MGPTTHGAEFPITLMHHPALQTALRMTQMALLGVKGMRLQGQVVRRTQNRACSRPSPPPTP